MVERERFGEYVRQALSHLYDHTFLRSHPLVELLGIGAGGQHDGFGLHQVLCAAIQSLKPPPEVDLQAASWRRFRYLELRFVQAKGAGQAAQELGISERQAQRDQREALDEIIEQLWRTYCQRPSTVNSQDDRSLTEAGGAVVPTASPRRSLETEAARIGSVPGEERASVQEVVQSVVTTTANLSARYGVQVDADIPGDLPPAAIGRSALRQVLLNLLLYAIENAAAGAVLLRATLQQQQIALRILASARPTDSGRGSADGADGRIELARALIHQQGSTIELRTELASIEITIQVPISPIGTVLLVDDNPDVLRLLARYLGGGAYRVISVTGAEEALRLARTLRPEVVTLDVMMPSHDGWELLQILKNDDETHDIPVIVCSVLRERELALSLGASDFLAKPVTRQALLQSIQRHFSTSSQPQASSTGSPDGNR